VTERFDADWLTLREPFDHAARSVALARRLADRLPKRPRLLDLGAGTGSLFRFLAPIIGRGQDWILIDSDAALLDDAFGRTAAWARGQGFAATAPGDTLLVSTPYGLWRMQAVQRDLTLLHRGQKPPPPLAGGGRGEGAAVQTKSATPLVRTPPPDPLPQGVGEDVSHLRSYSHTPRAHPGHDDEQQFDADAILCSALLDLVSAAWLARLFDKLHVPFLACLTADGRDAWRPSHPNDALVRSAFRRDQWRDKGFGPALGMAAPSIALKALTACEFATASAPTDWRVPRAALRMQRALIDCAADAARNARPALHRVIADWQEARLRAAMQARLAIRIGHRDILALPTGVPLGGPPGG
jgi:SAM-dependent methyltransferase